MRMSFVQTLWDRIDPEDRKLVKAFFYMQLLVIGLGGLLAIFAAASRVPVLGGALQDQFYNFMTGHATLIFFYGMGLFSIILVLGFGLGLLETNTKLAGGTKLGWVSFWLIAISLVLSIVAFLLGADTTYMANPVTSPFQYTWIQHLSYTILSFGSIIIYAQFMVTALRKRPKRNLNHLAFACGIVALLGLFGYVAVLYTMYLGLGPLVGISDPVATGDWDHAFHFYFHIIHYVPLVAMYIGAFIIAYQWNVPTTSGEKYLRAVWGAYMFLVPPTWFYHFLLDPAIPPVERATGSVLALLVDVPPIILFSTWLAAWIILLRSRTNVKGGWLRNLPWGSPDFAWIICGFIIMAIPGALAGGSLIAAGIAEWLSHSWAVPGYFHPVAGAVLMSFFGIAHYLIPLMTKRKTWNPKLAIATPYMFAGGMVFYGLGGIVSGYYGLPRRFADITVGAEAGVTPPWIPWMNVAGIGMLITIIAGVCFMTVMVMTALKGERVEEAGKEYAGVGFGEAEVIPKYRPLSQWAYTVAQIPGIVVVLMIWGIALISLILMTYFPIIG